MDKKISEFGVATTVSAADLIPIVSSGINKSVTAGVLSLNQPNLGNKGITKNTVVVQTVAALPLTSTVILVDNLAYTLATGSDGQTITLISSGSCSLTCSAYFTSVSLVQSSTLTLIYSSVLTKWVVQSSHNCTFL